MDILSFLIYCMQYFIMMYSSETYGSKSDLLGPSGLKQNCDHDLGMQSGDIPDDNLAVSSSIPGPSYGKENARLNGESAWVTHANNQQWIEIDLGETKYVSGVKTQGKLLPRNLRLWVTEFKVLYKINPRETQFQVVKQIGESAKVFRGNHDALSVKTNFFPFPIQAQVVRVVPVAWAGTTRQIALRLELMGCEVVGRSGCGSPRILTNRVGYISSMNYPNNYRNNANCRWDIRAPEGKVVVLRFQENFHLESDEAHQCQLDYVEVIDDVETIQNSLGKFCGTTSPGKFVSTDNILKIHFVSDHFETYKGFKARYSFVNGSGCGGSSRLLGNEGVLQSMNYPEHYRESSYCVWNIQTSPNKLIEIRFLDFNIAGTSNQCHGDSLQITRFASPSESGRSQVETRLCGPITPQTILSPSNQLKLVFSSDDVINRKGFRATFQTFLSSGCGSKKILKEERGTIQSPNYPEPYANNLRCEWNIIAGPNQDIRLLMRNFRLEAHHNCEYDHLAIYDGRSRRFLLGKYCSEIRFRPIVAHSGAMKIVFESDERNTREGFEATYEMITRETITITATPALPQTTSMTLTASSVNTTKANHIHQSSTIAEQYFASTIKVHSATNSNSTKPMLRNYNTSSFKTTTETRSTKRIKKKDDPFVSEEFAKWIIIGMISLTGILVLTLGIGMIVCCKRRMSEGFASAHGSLRNTNSGMMQNHAYDFSAASTSQSIRSRQVEDSSQVSESASHQGTLGRELNRDSHIYFSIDDYYRKESPTATPQQVNEELSSNTEVHYSKCRHRENEGETSADRDSDESAQSGFEDEYDDDYNTDENDHDETIDGSEENNFEETGDQRAPPSGETSTPSTASLPLNSSCDRSKQMVANILYVSTDKEEV